jgi:dolichol kinase
MEVVGGLRWQLWAMGEEEMPSSYFAVLCSVPLVVLSLMVVWLRIWWPSPSKPSPALGPKQAKVHQEVEKYSEESTTVPSTPRKGEIVERSDITPEKVAAPGTCAKGEDVQKPEMLKECLLEAGESVESEFVPYTAPWTDTFDLTFLVGYIVGLAFLIPATYLLQPEVLCLPEFLNLALKFGVMLTSSLLGGSLVRACCEFDERGYVSVDARGKTKSKVKGFKVNYTRKIQHFCAYAVPIMVPSPFASETAVTVAWGNMATLLGFLIVIQPLRELAAFFMMQFNSFDRPEDRPFTLKWMVLGDIVPGMIVMIFFYVVWAPYSVNGFPAHSLCYIFAMVAGLGDGLAEPVGVQWGTHKYEVGAIMAGNEARKYQRSLEGSCCVAFFTYVFIAQKWYLFVNATAFWLTMLVLPPLMAWAEARSPHTCDTPFLFIVGGAWLWLALNIPAIPLLEP